MVNVLDIKYCSLKNYAVARGILHFSSIIETKQKIRTNFPPIEFRNLLFFYLKVFQFFSVLQKIKIKKKLTRRFQIYWGNSKKLKKAILKQFPQQKYTILL